MNLGVHFMSERDDWTTPQKFFDDLNAEFGFTLDPCCSSETAKCPKFFTKEHNGLLQDWTKDTVFMNPPYGRQISAWMKKAYETSLGGGRVVCLVPARTDTAWWHEYAMRGTIRFVRGRLKFGDGKQSAPFPSAVVIFDPRQEAVST